MDSPMTFRSDRLVEEVLGAIEAEDPDWKDRVRELCSYHLEMRDHALRCERTIHRLTKGD